ncbi:RNA polymerase II transcription factor SIII subunit A-domain-containing protein [Thelonectria olida]|uniref:RNA polymerase II transcription factor SIII subunit A-domain-containing protein n=1 Tax=Thelonectria olida TaxID=1576542 RepID=A0A9P8WG88_9HYPO|nr:RNA polymerase II transcription factor SIII subunit A-domain-containing protein [Thelonectria olida]
MPVKSLMELALTACLKNHREIDSVGDFLTYELVRPILLKIDNAHQLRQIELNSPQIQGDTGEVWLKIIERDFPMELKTTAYKPPDPTKWYRVWEKYKKDHDRALEESENKLKNALNGLMAKKQSNMSGIADKNLDKKLLPRTAVRRSGWGQRDPTSGTFAFSRGSRTKTNTGASVMRKVRREVKEIANIHGSLSRPTRGQAALTRPARAPTAMVNDVRRASQPVYRPTPKPVASAVEEYEERATYLSDSGDEDSRNELFDDEDEDEELRQPPARKSFVKSSATSLLKKRPAAMSSTSPGKSRAPISTSSAPRLATKRSGILSNNYKPAGSRAQTVSSTSSSSTRPASSSDSARPSQRLPRVQTSPPPAPNPGPSSPPPPPLSAPISADAQSRKRKAVNIFMSRKKR